LKLLTNARTNSLNRPSHRTLGLGLHFAACILFLSGCAFQGVVIEKRFRPLPFYDSLGMDGIYKFELRDRAGHVRTQMVTPQVFAAYEVGDYFSDLRPVPWSNPNDVKSTRPMAANRAHRQRLATTTKSTRHSKQRGKKVARIRHRPHKKAGLSGQPRKSRTKLARRSRKQPIQRSDRAVSG